MVKGTGRLGDENSFKVTIIFKCAPKQLAPYRPQFKS